MSFDLNSMPQFDAQLRQVNQQRAIQDEQANSFDERFIYFKAGKNYRFRLCWPVDPNGVRKFPFIFSNIHVDRGIGRSNEEVVCPTSDYISGKAGYRQCPVCAESSKFYKDYDEHKNKTSYELYKHFKRKSNNIALVYVISDGQRPENNGKFMLARFAPQIADYIRRKVFGWALKKGEAPLDNDQIIGQQAFLMDNGVDMVVSVGTETTSEGEFNSYTAEFLPKATKLPVTQADVNKAGIELKFDEDFYKTFDAEKAAKFVKENVLGLKMEYELNGVPQKEQKGSGKVYDPSAVDPNVSSSTVAQPTTGTDTFAGINEDIKPEDVKQSIGETKKPTNNLEDIMSSLGIK